MVLIIKHKQEKNFMKTIQDILKQLEILSIKSDDDHVTITLPVCLYMNWNCVELIIKPTEKGYVITDTGDNFNRFNNVASYYYDLFIKSGNRFYDIQLDNETIFKEYEFNFSIIAALDEFIRFFANLDDFVLDNNLC